ncbi:hypothetical protein L1987_29846 [Smallanthus sonchifolius]|uniref:Uncharacterized protein n=1 Tax=Smallanthus sonchifolius TaxID=185202 RepID=A0ACB9I3U5_9ASTR|nr:hypothetical protein L1987_29846 [Smallanthus sonchifolius]
MGEGVNFHVDIDARVPLERCEFSYTGVFPLERCLITLEFWYQFTVLHSTFCPGCDDAWKQLIIVMGAWRLIISVRCNKLVKGLKDTIRANVDMVETKEVFFPNPPLLGGNIIFMDELSNCRLTYQEIGGIVLLGAQYWEPASAHMIS